MLEPAGTVIRLSPRAALCVGIGSFDDSAQSWSDLPFASDKATDTQASVVRQVGDALDRFGFQALVRHDLTREELDDELKRLLRGSEDHDGLVVVHLVGHGLIDQAGRLRFVDRRGAGIDLDTVVADVQESRSTSRTVFMLDMCGAGLTGGALWSSELGDDRRVWTLGACTSTAVTQQGRFSKAIARALHCLADTDYPTVNEPIDFAQFSRELIKAKDLEGCGRISRNYDIDQGDGDWPFLPNPLAVVNERSRSTWAVRAQQYLPELDIGALIAALEPDSDIDDTAHFADRASGRALSTSSLRIGLFTGRRAILDEITSWLAGTNPLLAVCGGPGAGKSALLGLIVCAGHPELRDVLRGLWRNIAGAPCAPIPGLIAAHARQRSAGEVMDAIADQAGLDPPARAESLGTSRAGWTTLALRDSLARAEARRVIVIDAVDESTEMWAIADLIRALALPSPITLRPAAKLLIGGRPEAIHAVGTSSTWDPPIDLDGVDRQDLENDVREYLERLLALGGPYTGSEKAELRGIISECSAPRLAAAPQPGDIHWGAFLVAGVFAHFLTSHPQPPQDELTARAAALQAAPDLPAVFELDLAARARLHPLLRPLLATLARARGEGMPRSVLRRAATAFLASPFDVVAELTETGVRETLALAHPYLRIGVDPSNGEKLYRLFHQGLVDHLRVYPFSAQRPADLQLQQRLELLMLTRMVRMPDPPETLAEDEEGPSR